jgi:oligopeptide/dipeptide ABC transporter ATP-binding protein
MSSGGSVTNTPIVSVRDLKVRLRTSQGLRTIVNGVNYEIARGRVFGIAGESGSGKTISMLALLGLLDSRFVISGTAMFDGQDLISLDPDALRRLRGPGLSLVMQDPKASLHPMLSIERQLTDHMGYHMHLNRRTTKARALQLLRDVRIPDPEGAIAAYPHQFSGGMLQRIAIAVALACEPKVLIADEPTTGLDVTVQAGILKLLDELRRSRDLTVVLITHDLGVMSAVADTVTILYAGLVVESGTTQQVFKQTRHPYTRALLNALPRTDSTERRLTPIPGSAATANSLPSGCAFHPRCSFALTTCSIQIPPLVSTSVGHWHACLVDPFAADRPLEVSLGGG